MFGVICNQCGDVCTEDADAARWWRLGRNFEGVGGGGVGIIESLASAVSTSIDLSIDLHDDEGDEPDPPPGTPEPDRTEFDDDPILHFCRTECLAAWSTLAASVEP